MIILINSSGQIERIVESLDYEDTTDLEIFERDVPEGYPEFYVWDSVTNDFVKDISRHKERVWSLVRVKRDQVERSGCETPFGRVDTDTDSTQRINGATLAAQVLGSEFFVEWTMADNTVISLDSTSMIQMAMAVMSHVSSTHQRARDLREQINSASTIEEVDSVDVETGWP